MKKLSFRFLFNAETFLIAFLLCIVGATVSMFIACIVAPQFILTFLIAMLCFCFAVIYFGVKAK
jgi:hypothetical protein